MSEPRLSQAELGSTLTLADQLRALISEAEAKEVKRRCVEEMCLASRPRVYVKRSTQAKLNAVSVRLNDKRQADHWECA